MDAILDGVGLFAWQLFDVQYDDDVADRLNHRQTTMLFVALALAVASCQYVGEPINCWVPAEFKDSDESKYANREEYVDRYRSRYASRQEYVDSYCWIRNTYYLPVDEDIPADGQSKPYSEVRYYQWVPVILLIQALLFYLPYVLWKKIVTRSGIDLGDFIDSGMSLADVSNRNELCDETLLEMTEQLHRFLAAQDNRPSLRGCSRRSLARLLTSWQPRRGKFLTVTFIAVKLLYIVIAVGQLFLLDVVFDGPYHRYGFDVLGALVKSTVDGKWTASVEPGLVHFPRSTMCDFKVRRLGNIHRYTVQCVLPINLFHETLFLAVWFWLVAVAVFSFLSAIVWTMKFVYAEERSRYIQERIRLAKLANEKRMVGQPDLTVADPKKKHRKSLMPEFVDEYLGVDGVFVVRLMGHNGDLIVVCEFIRVVWENFLRQKVEAGVDVYVTIST